jgi:hypothetical protein
MANWGNAGTGALAGASAGSAIMPGWGTAIGAGVGGLAGLFGGDDEDPEKDAGNYLDQIPEAMRPYFQDYINSGKKNLGDLNGQYDNLTGDPGAFVNKIGANYTESPGYQARLHSALTAGTNAQASGGMAGTPQHQEVNMETAGRIAGEDYENYLKHALGQYNRGLKGKEGLNSQGYDASKGYGENIGSALGAKAGLSFEGAKGRNANRRNQFGQLVQGASNLGQQYSNNEYRNKVLEAFQNGGDW